MTGGNYSLTGGFWALFAVQSPGAPLLSIERIGSAVRVFWPKTSAGFLLDQSFTVKGPWSQVSFPYTTRNWRALRWGQISDLILLKNPLSAFLRFS